MTIKTLISRPQVRVDDRKPQLGSNHDSLVGKFFHFLKLAYI